MLVVAAAVVLGALAALVTLPLVVTIQIEKLRREIEERAQPARTHLNQVNAQLANQIASLSRATATGDEDHLADYRAAVAAQSAPMAPLAAETRALGPDFARRFAELEIQSRRWHLAVDRYLEERRGNPSRAGQRIAYEADYPAVIDAVHRLDEAISAFQSSHRRQIRRWTQWHVRLSAILVVFAVIAALAVLWMLARFRTLASQLAHESQEHMAGLQRERRIRQTAESLLRSRDEILGVVSHDLRSPLTTIALSTQLMQGSSADEQAEHLETILTTTRRMERLIQDLLDVTKIESSALSIRRETIDPAAIADEVIAAHRPIAAEKNIELKSSIETPLPEVCGDRDRLIQALSNLLGNGFKFTPAGGVVQLIAQAREGMVRFTVSDTGPGIAPSDLPHLFEPFWQARKTAHLGAGLGLKITRAIVEAHGGSIHVTNASTGGACFTFDLPAASSDSQLRS
jgi:signal transduction histidine kinase